VPVTSAHTGSAATAPRRRSGQADDIRAASTALGIVGAPGYLIGKMLVNGALDADEFKRVFRDARTRR
jgi:hypothetical protein